MSVSGISSGMSSGTTQEMLEKMRAMREQGNTAGLASMFVEQDDADGDGLLSLDEAMLDEDHFNEADADGDGFLSEEELAADMQTKMEEMRNMMSGIMMGMQGMAPPDATEMASAILGNQDTDGDGQISLDEFWMDDEEQFSLIDADGDGFLTEDEIAADMEAKAAEREAMLGSSGIGMEGMGQTTPPSGGLAESSSDSEDSSDYDQYDLNEDGTVTMDELFQAFQTGDLSLSDLFGDNEGTSSSVWRLASKAYEL